MSVGVRNAHRSGATKLAIDGLGGWHEESKTAAAASRGLSGGGDEQGERQWSPEKGKVAWPTSSEYNFSVGGVHVSGGEELLGVYLKRNWFKN
jgi:hypothetical protein